MSKLKFKTNIKCGGCIATVTPFIEKESSIKKWEVDLNDPDRTMIVEGDNVTADLVIKTLKEAGYTAEAV